MDDPMLNAFVCGHPVAHSRSPLIHGHWLKTYGIAGSYKAVDVPPHDFAAFVGGLRQAGYRGGNVTLPNKEAAYALAEVLHDDAREIGAANTLWFEDGRLNATNTDAYGFCANLDAAVPEWTGGRIALILGAGGASRAIVHALLSRGFSEVRIVNRTVARAQELADRFGARVSAHPVEAAGELAADAGLLVNTTSLGMDGQGELPADVAALPAHAVVTDIVYVPLETPLLAAARRRGLKAVDGLGMLLHQAVPGFERWFGRRPEVTADLHALVVADLEAHA